MGTISIQSSDKITALQTTSAVAIKCQTPSGTPLLEFYTAIAQPTIEAENTAQGGGDTDEW